ncbi:MAG: radical SAM protein [Mollicutes bacterium]|nr:radical SAM protein [Mollicutes bacterium]
MNKLELHSVAFEVTRRCNLKCVGFCMRGEAQNFDMTKEMVDAFFDTESRGYILDSIHNLYFTGGEPTLKPEIIIYTINKIIEENIPVCNITMVTNGQLFVLELVDAFNRFNKYRSWYVKNKLQTGKEIRLSEIIEYIMNKNYAKIVFSTDRFHAPIPENIRNLYSIYTKEVKLMDYAVKDEYIVRIGLSSIGKDFKKEECEYDKVTEDHLIIWKNVYMTAKGDIMFGGDGSYQYIDDNIIGQVNQVSVFASAETHNQKKLNYNKFS